MTAFTRTFGALAIAALVSTSWVGAQQTAPQTFNPQDVIPVESVVREGTLPNGLKFIIRQNGRPEKRVSMRLAVKAGSINETDQQLGLAHFIEHMAFNGSTNFKPGEVFSYFESVGAQLGPHVNASTSFDETVYRFDLPTNPPEVVTKGLTALSDFAGGLSFDPVQVDKERGVVIEEWRGRLSAGSRILDQQLPMLFYRSRYADRLPIGKPEIIQNAPPALLKSFYDAWYRPDRMAVIVVGDISVQQMEAAIRSAFGTLRARGTTPSQPDTNVPLIRETMVKVTTDPEVTQSTVELISKRPKESERLVGDYRRSLVERLFYSMFDDRFSELARKPDSKFLSAGVGGGGLGKEVSTFELSARVKDGGMAEGLAALAVEAKRVREYGFTASELDRAKRDLLAFYDRAYQERDKSDSGQFADEYLRHFLTDESIPGIAYEYRLVQWALPTITLADVSTLAKARLSDESRVILAVAPQKAGLAAPTETSLQDALGSGERVAVTPWSDSTTTRALIETKPTPGTIASRREIADIGVTVVRFSNGLEVWLKPTDFKNDQILFTLYSLGGTSLAAQADYLQAEFATQYVGLSGAGGLKALDLSKLLAGKLASASPFISTSTHGFNGSASPAELETALQLLYQRFTAPGDDPDAFALMKRQLEAAIANRGQNPDQVFGERADQILTSNHFTSQPLTADRLATLDRAKMFSFYRERFSNAADFTMFMVGAFKVDTALPLLAQYVGALPSTGRRTAQFKDLGVKFPATTVHETVVKGREPSAQTLLAFAADIPPEAIEQERINAATTVLDTTLRDVLREDLGQTYTVSVGLSQSYPQRGDGYTAVSFGASPQNIQPMIDRVMKEIARLQQDGPSADLVNKAKEAARRGYETSLKENSYWMGRLQRIHQIGANPSEILTRPARIDTITPAVVQETLKKYFPLDRYAAITLTPETTPAPATR